MDTWQDLCEKQGWNDNTQVQILLDYIERQNDDRTFANYLSRIATEENEDALLSNSLKEQDICSCCKEELKREYYTYKDKDYCRGCINVMVLSLNRSDSSKSS